MNIITTAEVKAGNHILDAYIREANRFTAERIAVDHSVSFCDIMADIGCEIYRETVTPEMFPFQSGGSRVERFQIVKFRTWGVTANMVLDLFDRAGLRPASLQEAFCFAKSNAFRARKGNINVFEILGSNSRSYDLEEYGKKPAWKRRPKWLGGESVARIKYPTLEDYGGTRWLLRTSEYCNSGWKPHVLFLAVHKYIKDEDIKLHPKVISRERYDSLPYQDEITLTDQSIPGFMFKYHNGVIVEVVRGEDIFDNQHGSLVVPEYGRNLFRPVFVPEP